MTGKVNVDESEEKKPPETQAEQPLRTPDGQLISLDDGATRASIPELMKFRHGPGAELHPDDAD